MPLHASISTDCRACICAALMVLKPAFFNTAGTSSHGNRLEETKGSTFLRKPNMPLARPFAAEFPSVSRNSHITANSSSTMASRERSPATAYPGRVQSRIKIVVITWTKCDTKKPPDESQGAFATGVKGVEPSESRFGDDRLNRWAPPLH